MRRDALILLIAVSITVVILAFFLYPRIERRAVMVRTIVVIRNDDPQPFYKFKELRDLSQMLIEEDVPATYSVIPYVHHLYYPWQDRRFLSYMNYLVTRYPDLFEIAQHGYTHDLRSHFHRASEFGGLSYDEQLSLMSEGRKILEEAFRVNPVVFVPPFDTYDANTLKAARALGFKVLSGGVFRNDTWFRICDGIVVIPATETFYNWTSNRTNDLTSLERSFDRVYEKGGLFVLEIHYYKLDSENLEVLKNLIEYMKSKDVAFMTLGELAKGILNGSIRRNGMGWLIEGPSLLQAKIFHPKSG